MIEKVRKNERIKKGEVTGAGAVYLLSFLPNLNTLGER
ncbi:hypothetical protein ECBD561099_4438 [Escherichia coli Bd5610_99]|nr:hypothetical protein ECBD561099_4438 [Escherichia coli Bd5610_99]